MTPEDILRIQAATEIPDIAWERAGLKFPKRATLGECDTHELLQLATIPDICTPEGTAFVSRAAFMLKHLEERASKRYEIRMVEEMPA